MTPQTSSNHHHDWIAAHAEGPRWTLWGISGGAVMQHESVTLPLGIAEPDFAKLYLELCSKMGAQDSLPLVISGSGLAPARMIPARPDSLAPVVLGAENMNGALSPATEILAVPGLAQKSPAALMQGPETRIRGFLSLNPSWDGVLCLPGATTHWVLISAEEVVSFQSFATGTLIKAALSSAGLSGSEWSSETLGETAADTISRPELSAARIAEAKAALDLETCSPSQAAGRIWGACLGAELAAARPYWLGQNLALVSDATLAGPYATALRAQGLPVTLADGERMALAGLTQVWRAWES